MRVPRIMTPGPTMISENVRLARAQETTNPDLDLQFFEFYRELCDKLAGIIKTNNEVRVLCGEGILGLEAACASLTEKGDRVLVLDNGIFGEGFSDFVTMYGGEPVLFKGDRRNEIDIIELEAFLQRDHSFKYATIVHCDTPTGVLNDLSKICPLLKSFGILTVVDSVAAMGGEELRVDDWKIDIALGGSQKCFSTPPGLTILSISEEAFRCMEERRTQIPSYYCNLLIWKDYYLKKWFPYTMPISDLMGLNRAIDNLIEDGNYVKRHREIGEAVYKTLENAGLELYIKQGRAHTVTAFFTPAGIDSAVLRNLMTDKYNVMIGASLGELSDKILRIGHMGENARIDKVAYCLSSLQMALKELGYKTKVDMAEMFFKNLN